MAITCSGAIATAPLPNATTATIPSSIPKATSQGAPALQPVSGRRGDMRFRGLAGREEVPAPVKPGTVSWGVVISSAALTREDTTTG